MRRRVLFSLLGVATTSLAVGLLVACAPEPVKNAPLELEDPDSSTSQPKKDGGGSSVDPEEDPPLPDGGKPPGRVYAHTADTLYLFEPISRKVSVVGKFSCLTDNDRVLDVALDRSGTMYATTDTSFMKVDPINANCTIIKTQDSASLYPNSLSFVPQGTVDATKEALVGYQFDENQAATVYVRIDLATGEITKIGDLNPTDAATQWRSAGDLISLIRSGNKAYLTVAPLTGEYDTDSLAEVDPKTGQIKTVIGAINQKDLWGFGYWAGTGYGFSEDGRIVEINMTTGTSVVVTTLELDGGGAGSWFGAGMTTDSPTKP